MRVLLIAVAFLALGACGAERKSAELPPLSALATISVQRTSSDGYRVWDGVVEAVQRADLSAQTAGRVSSVDADVNDGVAAGEVLLRLTAVEQQAGANVARAQLRAAEAAAREADATMARYTVLAQKQLVSRLQIDQLRATRERSAAAVETARAQLVQAERQTDYTVVRAPFSGLVSARHVEPGESVVIGQPLLTVYSPDALRIQVQVPQSEAAAVGVSRRAHVALVDGREIEAASVTVFPSADPAAHSVTVRLDLPELADPPRPGATAKVVFLVPGAAGPLRIPRSALVQRGEISAVYVLDGKRLLLRQLRLGAIAGDQVEVLAGLNGAEEVAADPVAALHALAAQRKAAGPARE